MYKASRERNSFRRNIVGNYLCWFFHIVSLHQRIRYTGIVHLCFLKLWPLEHKFKRIVDSVRTKIVWMFTPVVMDRSPDNKIILSSLVLYTPPPPTPFPRAVWKSWDFSNYSPKMQCHDLLKNIPSVHHPNWLQLIFPTQTSMRVKLILQTFVYKGSQIASADTKREVSSETASKGKNPHLSSRNSKATIYETIKIALVCSRHCFDVLLLYIQVLVSHELERWWMMRSG